MAGGSMINERNLHDMRANRKYQLSQEKYGISSNNMELMQNMVQ